MMMSMTFHDNDRMIEFGLCAAIRFSDRPGYLDMPKSLRIYCLVKPSLGRLGKSKTCPKALSLTGNRATTENIEDPAK